MMILSTQTSRTFEMFGEEEGLRLLAEAGYDAADYSMFMMSRKDCRWNQGSVEEDALKLRRTAEKYGLFFNQAHAPFPEELFGVHDFDMEMPDCIKRSVKIAGLLGAKAVVVHPLVYPGGDEIQKAFNLRLYRQLEPIALQYHTKVAIENMWDYDRKRGCIVPCVCSFGEDLASYLDDLNPEAFTVCLDVGHSSLVGDEPAHAVRVLGNKRLGALHIHDTDYVHDAHTVPYDFGMKLDWEDITKALGEIDYQGDLTYEADSFLSRFDREIFPAAMRLMVEIGRHLTAKIDAARPGKESSCQN